MSLIPGSIGPSLPLAPSQVRIKIETTKRRTKEWMEKTREEWKITERVNFERQAPQRARSPRPGRSGAV